MKFKRQNISKEKIYTFRAEEDLSACIEQAKSLIDASVIDSETEKNEETYTFKIKNQEYNSLLSRPELEPLHSWFKQCIDIAMQDLGFEKDELEITHSWGNRFGKLECAQRHTDKYSIMTGIFILSSSYNKNLFFRYPTAVWYKMLLSHTDSSNYYIEDLSPGELFLFPSSVPHGTTPGEESSDPLYTISFNTFLKDFKKRSINYKPMKDLV